MKVRVLEDYREIVSYFESQNTPDVTECTRLGVRREDGIGDRGMVKESESDVRSV